MARKGIILTAGLGTRLRPVTLAINKQLVPIYDKPMVYYPLWSLLKAGVRDILLVCSERDVPSFRSLLGDGSRFGIHVSYEVQRAPLGLVDAFMAAESFVAGDPCVLILGDNVFYGPGFPALLQKASARERGATVFGARVHDPERFGVAEVDEAGKVLSLEEKPSHPKSNCAVVGLYFFDGKVMDYAKELRRVIPPDREVSITDVNRRYMEQGELHLEVLPQGFVWLDTGTHDSLLEASNYVARVEREKGHMICCPEEAAYSEGWLDAEKIKEYGEADSNNIYGRYLTKFYNEIKKER
ncbi:MAG: glucose-1-phosphate thymidylyltransferase RfbA [Pyramidobacter sp.]